jgi:hypothetical protein
VSRETRRRRPRSAPTVGPIPSIDPRPLTQHERSRLHQRYAHLAGRSVELGYASLGIVVPAGTPADLVEATDAVIAALTLAEPEN